MTLEDKLDHKDQWKKLSQKELEEVLDKHDNFVNGQREGERAPLGMDDLSSLDMSGKDLSRAELTGAIPGHRNLEGAKMDDVILFAADLRFTNRVDARRVPEQHRYPGRQGVAQEIRRGRRGLGFSFSAPPVTSNYLYHRML